MIHFEDIPSTATTCPLCLSDNPFLQAIHAVLAVLFVLAAFAFVICFMFMFASFMANRSIQKENQRAKNDVNR